MSVQESDSIVNHLRIVVAEEYEPEEADEDLDDENQEDLVMMSTGQAGELEETKPWQKKIAKGKAHLARRCVELESKYGKVFMLRLFGAYERYATSLHPGKFGLNKAKPVGLQLMPLREWYSVSYPRWMFDAVTGFDWISNGGVQFLDFYDRATPLKPQLDELAKSSDPTKWCLKLDLTLLQKFTKMETSTGASIAYVLFWIDPVTGEVHLYAGFTKDGILRLLGHKKKGVNRFWKKIRESTGFDAEKIIGFELFRAEELDVGYLVYVVEHFINVLGRFTNRALLGGFRGLNVRILDCVTESRSILFSDYREIWAKTKDFHLKHPDFKLPPLVTDYSVLPSIYREYHTYVDPEGQLSFPAINRLLHGDTFAPWNQQLQADPTLALSGSIFLGGDIPVRFREDREEVKSALAARQALVQEKGRPGKGHVLSAPWEERVAREARRDTTGIDDPDLLLLASIAKAAAEPSTSGSHSHSPPPPTSTVPANATGADLHLPLKKRKSNPNGPPGSASLEHTVGGGEKGSKKGGKIDLSRILKKRE